MHRSLKLPAALIPLTLVGAAFLPGVAGAQTTEPPKQCPPPTIYSSWADYDDVYTVKLANHLTPLGLSCQHGSAGLVMSSGQTVLSSVVVPLFYILPGGVGQGPPAEVVLPRPDFPCGSRQVRIDLVPADVAAGLAPGQLLSGSSWTHKLETVDNGICSTPVPSTTQPALRVSATTAVTAPTLTIADVTTTTAAALAPHVAPTVTAASVAPAAIAPLSTTAAEPSTSVPSVTAAESTTTSSLGTQVLSASAAPATTIAVAPVALTRQGNSRAGLAVALGGVLAGLGVLVIGWRRRAA